MLGYRKSVPAGNFLLTLLDYLVVKLHYSTAGNINQMVVMFAIVDLKDRMTAIKMMTGCQASAFELGQHTIDCGQRDFFARVQQHLVYVLCFQMSISRIFQQFKNFHARQSYLQARVLNISRFHRKLSQYLQHIVRRSIISPCFAKFNGMILRLFKTVLVIGCLIVTLPGCLYRMDIPQGNRLDDGLEQQLEIGMSRSQVEFLLGSPAIIDLYRPDHWYYYYYLKTGDDGKIEKRQLKLTFSNDLLSKIEGSLSPG